MGLEVRFLINRVHERRKAERVQVQGNLYLDYRHPGSGESGYAQGKDLSARGICFACDSKFPKRTSLDLTIRFSPYYGQQRPIQARVFVVHCYRELPQRHYRMGVVFDNLDPSSYNEIRAFIHWLKKQESESYHR